MNLNLNQKLEYFDPSDANAAADLASSAYELARAAMRMYRLNPGQREALRGYALAVGYDLNLHFHGTEETIERLLVE